MRNYIRCLLPILCLAPACEGPTNPPDRPTATLVGAGDIAGCDLDGQEVTAALLDTIPGIVFTAGDNAYPQGTAQQYAECYDPSWGRHKDRTRPALGNHDFRTDEGAPYYAYFGDRAGPPGRGHYSYRAGAWHVIVLNSNLDLSIGSKQHDWLVADLASADARCTLAYWHHPRFSSSRHGSQSQVQDAWAALYDAGAEIAIGGHDHDYERFAPMNASGDLDPDGGVRQFVVGTGGRGTYEFNAPQPNSQVRLTGVLGVLRLSLAGSGYDWAFISGNGEVLDSGTGVCH